MRLSAGLVLYGWALALLVKADLGLDPWDVFSQGVSRRTGLSLGTVIVMTSVVVMVAWLPLRQRPGLGTVGNALLVGPMLDLGLNLLPSPHLWVAQAAFLAAAIIGVALATGLYVGAGWGPGPRDGLMTGLADQGIPIFAARAGIEVTVLVVGWALGGDVGIGTALFALTIGPLVAVSLRHLSVSPPTRRAAS